MRNIPSPPLHILDVLLGVVNCNNDSNNSHEHVMPSLPDNRIKPKDPRVKGVVVAERQPQSPIQVEVVHEDGEIKDPAEQPNKKPRKEGRVPCKYWMEGKCSKGDACTFNHTLIPNKTPSEVRSEHHSLLSLPPEELIKLADSQGKTLWETLSTGVCRFKMGQNGSCGKGEACLYSHDLKKLPCRYWHSWGRCGAGKECRFGHDRIAEVLRERIKREAIEAVQKERATIKTRDAGESAKLVEASDVQQQQDDDLEKAFQEELARQLNPFA